MEAAAVILPQDGLAEIAEHIVNGEAAGIEALYQKVHRGLCYYFTRHLGSSSAEDLAHDVLLATVDLIRQRRLREPESMLRLIWVIAKRQLIAAIRELQAARTNGHQLPELPVESDSLERVQKRQQIEIAARLLRELPSRGREVLVRFYLREQPPNQICAEMGITENQFRLTKWRAKARFTELVSREIATGRPALAGRGSTAPARG